jgi:hypothetical protein
MNLEIFLTQISNITEKYDEIHKIYGDKFNIFNLLNLSSDELSHSKLIGTFLNPKGMHGNENKFLKLFLDCIEIDDFSIDNVIVKTEKFIGSISADYKRGGIIDIVLTNSKKNQIFIENKIYADDQRNQLLRYKNYNPKACLLYLTLFGNDPSKKSIGYDPNEKNIASNKRIDYIKISYKEHILKWLELCKIESIDNPILHETLTQYIVLVKQLTGQARSKEMQKKYLDIILKNADNVSAAFIISQNIDEVKKQILKDKFVPLMEKIGKKYGLDLNICLDDCLEKEWEFYFSKPKEWEKLRIVFQSEKSYLHSLFCGICSVDIPRNLNRSLRNLTNYKHSRYWPLWQYMDPYRDWNEDFFTELYSPDNNISDIFENIIEDILLIVENKEYKL